MYGAVFDTNVLFEGLTNKASSSHLLVKACLAGNLASHVSNALLYEYLEIFERKLSAQRWQLTKPILRTFIKQSHYVPIYFSYRPSSLDSDDDFLIDCVMNAQVPLITYNLKDFLSAKQELGFELFRPHDYILYLNQLAEYQKGASS
ncbi:MAG: PIN domain-containing protein [Deinococcales bacterium]